MNVVYSALLSARPPYDLRASLRALSGFAPCAGDQLVSGSAVRKAWALPGAASAVVTEVGPRPDGEPGVAVSVFADRPLSGAEAALLEGRVRDWLGLADDLAEFLAVAGRDPAMAPVLAATAGLHQVRFPTLAEAAVFFLLTHRASPTFAAARKRRIAAELGPRLTVDGVAYTAFPTLEVLAGLSVAEWTPFAGSALGRDARLAEVLGALVHLEEEWLRTAPYAEVKAALLAIRGVGVFTVHALLLRGLGRAEDIPVEMAQFTDVAEHLYGSGVTAGDLRARYGPSLGWWGYFGKTALAWSGVPTSRSTAQNRAR